MEAAAQAAASAFCTYQRYVNEIEKNQRTNSSGIGSYEPLRLMNRL